MTMLIVRNTLLMTFAFSVSSAIAGEVPTFSTLPAGQELRMMYTTIGCFHYKSYELLFQRQSDTTVTVNKVNRDWSKEMRKYTYSNPTPVGTLTLTKADLQGLDRLMQFYRSNRPEGCTTVDTISIAHWRDGKPIESEEFTDGSCAQNGGELTIPELIARLRTK